MTSHLDGNLVLRDRIVPGRVTFGTHIHDLEPLKNAGNRYILPGFIDGHVHGGGGADTMDGVEAIETLSRFHMSHGTAVETLLRQLEETGLPDPLLSQFLPVQYEKIRDGLLPRHPRAIILSAIDTVLGLYDQACGAEVT